MKKNIPLLVSLLALVISITTFIISYKSNRDRIRDYGFLYSKLELKEGYINEMIELTKKVNDSAISMRNYIISIYEDCAKTDQTCRKVLEEWRRMENESK